MSGRLRNEGGKHGHCPVCGNLPASLLHFYHLTAALLLLKDSKSSFAIEGERPPQDRIQRWGQALGEAGGLLRQNDGRLSKRSRKKELAALKGDEIRWIEEAYADLFGSRES